MSHPYVPLGTPVTITVDGFWDGDHNGNQPVIVVPNGQGENKKFHLPHGARVHTRPNVVEAVEFTVDKTPKPQPTYPDFSKPKLRTLRTPRSGTMLWFEVKPGWFVFAKNRSAADGAYAKYHSESMPWGASEQYLEEHYDALTDVTDTGEPLVHSAAADIPERFQCSRCDDSDDAFCAEHTYWSTKNAEFQRFWREFNETGAVPEWANDTPRKPEPGDRVRVSYEGTLKDGLHHTFVDVGKSRGGMYAAPKDAEVTVIEPARPAVPEDPKCMVINDDDEVFWWDPMDDDGQDYTDGNDRFGWPALWAHSGPFRLVERGAVID